MAYPKGVKEYVLIKLETVQNKTHIAKEVKRVFKLKQEIEAVRKMVRDVAEKACIQRGKQPIKRLFFDIETSFYQGWFWDTSFKARIGPHQILDQKKVICIGYKWQYENQVRVLKWDKNQDDTLMLQKFMKILGSADEIIAHNGDRFDLKVIRTRCIKAGILMFPKYRTLDTLTKSRKYFKFPSNKLGEIAKFLNVGSEKMDDIDYSLWVDIVINKSAKALKKMIDYCKQDVIVLEDIFTALNPYIDHNTNHAVKKMLDKWHCPECTSARVRLSHTDTTPMGYIKRHMKCLDCKKFFHTSNTTYLRWIGSRELNPNKLK